MGSVCPQGQVESGGLCYKQCPDGYYAAADRCYTVCPPNTSDDGALTCYKRNVTRGPYKSESECLSQSKFGSQVGCTYDGSYWYSNCPNGFYEGGTFFYDNCVPNCPTDPYLINNGGISCTKTSIPNGGPLGEASSSTLWYIFVALIVIAIITVLGFLSKFA